MATRDPSTKIGSAAATVTWTGFIGFLISELAPQMPPDNAIVLMGGILLMTGAAGSITRDYIHECETDTPPRRAPFLIRSIMKYVG